MLKRLVDDLALFGKALIFTWRLKRDLCASKGHIVLVYQMAKVGSSSVYQSLRNSLKIPVYHTHFLSASGIRNAERFFRDAGAAVPSNLRYSAILRDHLRDMHPVVVTLVRDPIARELSNYLQIGNRGFEALKQIDGRRGSGDDLEDVLDELALRIRKLCDEEHHIVHTWFDNEIGSVFGVDVYAQPFDFEKGYVAVSGERCTILLYRLEDLDRSFENGVHKVFGSQDGLELCRRNVGSEKAYADLYRDVKSRMRVDLEVCKAIYSTRFGRHFYADKADELTRKWSRADD